MTAPTAPEPPSDGSRPTVLVLAGGGPTHPGLVLPPVDLVVAADSGAERAAALGLAVDALVGDLDSISALTLAALRAAGTRVVRHHPDKDATDVELALAVAAAEHPAAVVLVGGDGGRLDHAIATLGALAAVAAPGRRVEGWMGPALVQLTVDRVAVDARPGELVSLVPLGGEVRGVTTTGLRWPLTDATLAFGTTWGVSNEAAARPAGVAVTAGVLAVVRPDALDPAADARRGPVPDRPEPDR